MDSEKRIKKMARFTFKKNDRRSCWDIESADIKLHGKICGWYQKRSDISLWEAWFCVEIPKDGCSWHNVRLKRAFGTEAELRAWLKQHSDAIQNTLPLHLQS